VIENSRIAPGDVIVGLSSTGQATYEQVWNAGMGSNGLTSARHDLFSSYLKDKYPESYDPALPEELVYTGRYSLTETVTELGMDAGKMVLSPTRTYAPVVHEVLRAFRKDIHGMIHCSGGGQTKILHFIDDLEVIKDNLFPAPLLFKAIQSHSGTSWEEMYKVYNMGHRFEFYVPEKIADNLIEISAKFGIEARIIGHCHPSKSRSLIIKSEKGTFRY
jgi:phosphoribosylformylglycinamidine cyclo-ligase